MNKELIFFKPKKKLNFELEPGIAFWGHNTPYGFLSNFYPCEIQYGDKTFTSSEQLYMWRKARFFLDIETSKKILEAETPREAKILGRQVQGFDEKRWNSYAASAMTTTLIQKFSDSELKQKLLDTGLGTLIESSPTDLIWGCGLKNDDPRILYEDNWTGLNLLGNCLMNVRAYYANSPVFP